MEGKEFGLGSLDKDEELSEPTELTCSQTNVSNDEVETNELVQLLKDDYNQFESQDRSALRIEVLSALRGIWNKWVKDVAILEKKDRTTVSNARCKIFTFGSYRLGVHCPKTDIDTLCVCPRFVDRK